MIKAKTTLQKVARNGWKWVIQLLFKKGADIQTREGQGKTALHYAGESGKQGLVQFLLEKAVDPASINVTDLLKPEWLADEDFQAATRIIRGDWSGLARLKSLRVMSGRVMSPRVRSPK